MNISELKEKLENYMRETGHGDKPIYVLDGDTSDTFDVNSVDWDELGQCFFIHVGISDE